MSADAAGKPEQIMEEIEQTRTDIAATLAALEVKLSPSRIWNELNSSLTPVRRVSSDFAYGLGASVRDNPLPTALIGLGICWLAVARPRDGRLQTAAIDPLDEDAEATRLDPWRLNREGVIDDMDEHAENGDEFREGGERISESARRAAREASERTKRLAALAREKSSEAYHRTSEAGSRAASFARSAAADGGEFARMHPVGIALSVLGVGAIVAAIMIARSERRRTDIARTATSAREYIEDTADRTIDAAREGAGRVRRAARNVSQRVKQAGSELNEHGGGAIDADDQIRDASQGLHDQERASFADPTSSAEPRERPS